MDQVNDWKPKRMNFVQLCRGAFTPQWDVTDENQTVSPIAHRSHRRGDPASPYFVNSGYIFAPATSANDSEISSDATTDDSMSMTDSSV